MDGKKKKKKKKKKNTKKKNKKKKKTCPAGDRRFRHLLRQCRSIGGSVSGARLRQFRAKGDPRPQVQRSQRQRVDDSDPRLGGDHRVSRTNGQGQAVAPEPQNHSFQRRVSFTPIGTGHVTVTSKCPAAFANRGGATFTLNSGEEGSGHSGRVGTPLVPVRSEAALSAGWPSAIRPARRLTATSSTISMAMEWTTLIRGWPAVDITIHRAHGTTGQGRRSRSSKTTDANGEYSLTPLAPGTYR